jgi:hypothetical protein
MRSGIAALSFASVTRLINPPKALPRFIEYLHPIPALQRKALHSLEKLISALRCNQLFCLEVFLD